MKLTKLFATSITIWALLCEATLASNSQQLEKTVQIGLKINGKTITASLGEGRAATEFAALLPLTLTLTDYASIEKVSDLPKPLSTEGEPAGSDAKRGDITYYAPWGNLAIFRKPFHHAKGLIYLGSLQGDWSALDNDGPITVSITRLDDKDIAL